MKELTVKLNPSEASWGSRYLLFETLILPQLLAFGVLLLGVEISGAWFNLLYYAINFTATLWIFRRFLLESLRSAKPGRIVDNAAGLLVVYYLASFAINYCIAVAQPDFFNVNDSAIAEEAKNNFLVTALGTIFLVPFAEELLFRGVLFGMLRRKSIVLAYALSAFLFALIHVMGYVGSYPIGTLLLCLLQYVPGGLCLAAAYERSDSIFCPILMHMVINTIGILAMR